MQCRVLGRFTRFYSHPWYVKQTSFTSASKVLHECFMNVSKLFVCMQVIAVLLMAFEAQIVEKLE